MILKRIESLQKILENNEAAIITNDKNRFYFTGFKSSAGIVIITKQSAYFLIDFRYFEKAKREVENLKVLLLEKTYFQIREILQHCGVKKVLLETEDLTVADFKRYSEELKEYEINDDNELSRYIKKLRSIKSDFEVLCIKEAQRITDETFSYILNHIKAGKTESEIMLEMEFFMRKKGSEGIAFDFIVVSGKNSSLPHGVPTDKKLENGDFITMDFGAVINGYRSDMTRTVALGSINDKQKKVYETVLKAQEAAINAIKPNERCCDIDKIARDIIEKAGYENCFGHGLGHSVGLDIHESPACNTRDKTLLESGMIMTVEPGIYLENEFGVRIEDMVLVTENGCENLTNSSKELIII